MPQARTTRYRSFICISSDISHVRVCQSHIWLFHLSRFSIWMAAGRWILWPRTQTSTSDFIWLLTLDYLWPMNWTTDRQRTHQSSLNHHAMMIMIPLRGREHSWIWSIARGTSASVCARGGSAAVTGLDWTVDWNCNWMDLALDFGFGLDSRLYRYRTNVSQIRSDSLIVFFIW